MPERDTSPTPPGEKKSAGMIPTLALPGDSTPGQFGPIRRESVPCEVVVDAQHVVRGNALGDADDRADARVRRLVDRVRGERRRHEHHRRVGAGLGHGLVHGVEDRDALDLLALLARGDAGDQVGAVVLVALAVELALPARSAPRSRASCPRSTRMATTPATPSFASFTTISAASSIVFAGCSCGASASARMRRPSSSLVPSSRTTIGTCTSIWSSAWRIPFATSSQRVIPPKMLNSTAFTFWIREQHLERGHDLIGLGAAAHVEEVRGAAARLRDHVERRHHEPGAVAEDSDLAVELHVRDATLLRHLLLRVLGGGVSHLGHLRAGGTARCRRRSPWRPAR